MSGITCTIVDELGEETEFKCLAIGHYFQAYILTFKNGVNVFESSCISVKTGEKTAFNLDRQKGFRVQEKEAVKRVHKFHAIQTIED